MNNYNRDQIGCDNICKSHTHSKTERELYRVCPGKLSKHELEDLYFALLENNIELKKTVNVQQDKIKVLSTKLQRMTVLKNGAGKEKDCGVSKAIVIEQKDSITELRKTNERMAERIRLLNMRLCSAKQFLKRSPLQTGNCKTCARCSFKIASMSALNPAKRNETIARTTTVSSQCLVNDVLDKATRTVESDTSSEVPEKDCEEKCKTMMDELKEKINNLQEELATSHSEYSQRIANLENLVSELNNENLRVRSDKVASEQELQQRGQKAELLKDQLRAADAKCSDLNMELSIEKRKVAELETGLRLANISNHVMKTIDQLAAEKEQPSEPPPSKDVSREFSSCLQRLNIHNKAEPDTPIPKENSERLIEIAREISRSQKNDDFGSSSKVLELPAPTSIMTKPEVKIPKSDDSGFTELNKSCETDDDQGMAKLNRELVNKIVDLQTQLDLLKIAAAGVSGDNDIEHMKKPKAYESYDAETTDDNEPQMRPVVVEDLNSMLLRDTPPVENYKKDAELYVAAPNRYETGAAGASKPWERLVIGAPSNDYMDNDNEPSTNSTAKVKFITKSANNNDNDHNDEMPVSIPAIYPSTNDRKKGLRNNLNSGESNERLKKKPSSEEKTVKIFENSLKENGSSTGKGECPEEPNLEYPATLEGDESLPGKNITESKAKLAQRTPTRDSIFVNRKKLMSNTNRVMAEVKKESATSFYLDSVCTPPLSACPVIDVGKRTVDDSTGINVDKPELCEARATICRCPATRRDVAVFRSCSGTLRFRTTAATDRLRRCACQIQTESSGSQIEPPPTPNQRDSATYTAEKPGTFTIPVEKLSRSTSPENTDREISSMTDLPSERGQIAPNPVERSWEPSHPAKPTVSAKRARVPAEDGRTARSLLSPIDSPRATLSPGEEKGTMTFTDTETETGPTDYGSLSEGEMPARKNARTLSIGETPSNVAPPTATSSEKMEATLKTISEELARCRRLLLGQRSKENRDSKDKSKSIDNATEGIEHSLRPSAANRHIADTHKPSCVFILHIGTLVLSDEAVVYSRDKSLALTWKFHTQNAAMARVQPGRVVQFDFVTQYELPFDDNFLEYMKNEDMPIILNEMNSKEEPFAMCSLPLREALLHANRRADMSLALIPAGTSTDSLGDEVGILDLWCTLRVDVALLPFIHRAMHMLSPPSWTHPNPLRLDDRDSKIIQQAVDDEVSSDRLSRDLDLINKHPKQSTPPEMFASTFGPQSNEDYPSANEEQSSRFDADVQEYGYTKPYRRRSTQLRQSLPSSDLGHKGLVGFQNRWPNSPLRQENSGIIINEVPASIKSPNDMKQALERNVQPTTPTKLPKIDDEASQIMRSSMGSVKSLAVKHQLSKLSKHKASRDRVDSLDELLKKKRSSLEVSTSAPTANMEQYIRDQDNERSKMNNISKYVAAPRIKRISEVSKKSVKYNDMPSSNEPQKISSADSDESGTQSIDITILWLALNEECEAMVNSSIQKLYVAYSFLGRRGADLETPFSLPKPKHYADKCYFNFKKTFNLHESDLPLLGHMSRCRAGGGASTDPRDCIVFTVISEPAEDPLGLSNCEDIGYAYLYLGDVLAYSGDSAGYTEVVGVRGVRGGVCGVLAVRVDQLPVLRRALSLSHSHRDLPRAY